MKYPKFENIPFICCCVKIDDPEPHFHQTDQAKIGVCTETGTSFFETFFLV